MENEILTLIATLNKATLKKLPCFIEQAINIEDINFRIGSKDGIHIIFRKNTFDLYQLGIQDKDGKSYEHPIPMDSDLFSKLQDIRIEIHTLNQDGSYTALVNKNFGIMLNSVSNLIEPVISKLP